MLVMNEKVYVTNNNLFFQYLVRGKWKCSQKFVIEMDKIYIYTEFKGCKYSLGGHIGGESNPI